MTTRLTPYGSIEHASNIAKVGKKVTPPTLALRMPSREIAAKVGVATVGMAMDCPEWQARRLVRLNAKG